MTQFPSPSVDEGLVSKVPTEVWVAYEDRAREIAHRAHSEATVVIKDAILRFALEARGDGVRVTDARVEAARMARTRLKAFADAANAGHAQAGGRELARKIWGAFAEFDALEAALHPQGDGMAEIVEDKT